MGGLSNDRLASELAIRCFRRLYSQNRMAWKESELHQFFIKSHYKIREKIFESKLPMMGCSALLVWILNDQLLWSSVGNASLFLYRSGSLEKLNVDHNFQELATRQGKRIGHRGDRLAQAWLYGCRLRDQAANLQFELGKDTGSLNLQGGERLLLSTNGLTNKISRAEISKAVKLPAPEILPDLWRFSERFDDDATAISLTIETASTS